MLEERATERALPPDGQRRQIFLDRYALKGPDGTPIESEYEETTLRVARAIAQVEPPVALGERFQTPTVRTLRDHWAERFAWAMAGFKFIPGGRILAGAGSGHNVTHFNCYCLPSPEDSREGILDNLKAMVEIMARGGGVGINLSSLRPKGSYVKSVNGTASGPVNWANLYSVATGDVIQQGGSRRGALMLMLDDTHPDVEEFVTVKRDHPSQLQYANLSVGISDRFMAAVRDDAEWQLVWQGEVRKTIRARALWHLICESAWASGEPGVVFMDRYNALSNTSYYERTVCVNPCWTGDTRVWTIDGPRSFAELAEAGQDVSVLSRDETGQLVYKTMRRPRLTRRDSALVEIVLTDGTTLRCTPDHQLYRRSGEKSEAQHLHLGDALASVPRGPDGPVRARESSALRVRAIRSSTSRADVYNGTVDDTHRYYVVSERRLILSANCGEQGLPAWGACNLGALNLSAFVRGEPGEPWERRIDWDSLGEHVRIAVRFLDDVIDASAPIAPLPQIEETLKRSRRVGLGTMGLADLLIKLEVRYGSDESLEIVDRLYAFVRDAAYRASVELAIERGSFPAFEPRYLEGAFVQTLPAELRELIARHGIRNATLLTQAPSGTTSLLAGVSSGIEPVFDFAVRRTDRTGEYTMYHPLYEAWWKSRGVDELHGKGVVTDPDYFVSASELTPEEHVRVQAKIQEYVDSSISKTLNAPSSHTVADVERIYSLAYELGCKGITYFRDGSREGVLESLRKPESSPERPQEQPALRIRPAVLGGRTYRVNSPVGTTFVTVNEDEAGSPFEVFVTVGKAGSDVAADAEALGRLISLALRIPSGLPQRAVLTEVGNQLRGIGGGSMTGFGANRVRSLADAVSRAFSEHLASPTEEEAGGKTGGEIEGKEEKASPRRAGLTGNYCPSCGQLALVNEEGCRKCYACGFAAC